MGIAKVRTLFIITILLLPTQSVFTNEELQKERRFFTAIPIAVMDLVLPKAEGFPLGYQLDAEIGLSVEVLPLYWLGAGTSIRYHWTRPSPYREGFAYRGFFGFEGRVFVTVRHPKVFSIPAFFIPLGADVGGLFRFDRYSQTNLYFFYPGFYIQPFFDLVLEKNPSIGFRIFVQVDFTFRQDLSFSLALGPGFGIRLSPF